VKLEAIEKRSEVPTRAGRVLCVGAVVLREDRALFVRQAAGHSLAGMWSIPWGIVENAESPVDAAVRETLEEGGIRAEVEGLLGIQDLPDPGWLGIAFLCRHRGGEPRPDGYETDQARYLALEDLDAFPEPFEPWCAWLVRRVLRGEHQVTAARPENPFSPRAGFF
jgi:ADP-ribose pyrophosphatase YjhB (NUDIX family)